MKAQLVKRRDAGWGGGTLRRGHAGKKLPPLLLVEKMEGGRRWWIKDGSRWSWTSPARCQLRMGRGRRHTAEQRKNCRCQRKEKRRTNKKKWVKKNREKKAAGIVEKRKAGSVALGGWGGSADRNRLAAG